MEEVAFFDAQQKGGFEAKRGKPPPQAKEVHRLSSVFGLDPAECARLGFNEETDELDDSITTFWKEISKGN